MSERLTERFIGRCKFCNLGEEPKRGILEILEKNVYGDLLETHPLKRQRTEIEATYKCALGELGEDCIIPKIYGMSVNIGKTVSSLDSLHAPIY